MATERIGSWKSMLALLDADQAPYESDEESQVVRLPVKSGPLDSHLYLRWEKHLPYVTAVCPLYLDVPAERIAAVESMCVRLNHAVALPGFGYDHQKSFIYYRLTIMIEPGGMESEFFRMMALACVNNARDFYLAVRGVVHGDPPEGVVSVATAPDPATKAAAAAAEYED